MQIMFSGYNGITLGIDNRNLGNHPNICKLNYSWSEGSNKGNQNILNCMKVKTLKIIGCN